MFLFKLEVNFSFFFEYIVDFLFSLSGHTREADKDADTSYNGSERAPVVQRLPKCESYQPKPGGPTSDYRQHSEQPAAQHPETASSVRESAVNTPPQPVLSQLSASASPAAVSTSLTKASTPPRVSAAPTESESPISAPGPPKVSSPDIESTPPQASTPPNVSCSLSPAAPPRLSSPPLLMQGLRPEITPAGSKHLSVGSSSSSLPASPPKLSAPLASTDSVSRPAAVSAAPLDSSPSSESGTHQTKSSGPPTTLSPPALVSISSYSRSAPISSLQQMVQSSKPPLMTSGAQHEKPGPPKLMPVTSSVGTPPLMSVTGPPTSTLPGSCLSTSASPMSVSNTPPAGSKSCDPAATTQHQTYTPPAADSGLSTACAATLPARVMNLPSLVAHESPTVRPLSTLPLLTTQASRTAPVSAPPALVSVPPAMSSGSVRSSDSEQHPSNTTPPYVRKQSPKPEHHGHHSEEREPPGNKRNGKPEEHVPHLDSSTKRTQKVDATETDKSEISSPEILTDLPEKPLQTTVAPDPKPKKNQTDSKKHHVQSGVTSESEDLVAEQTPLRKSSHLRGTRTEQLTDEESFDNSSQFDDNSTSGTPPRIDVSSVLEKSSLVDDDSSCVDDSTHFDDSFHVRKDTSRFGSTSYAEEETSTAFDTTRDSSSSVEDSRGDTLDSTREGETSEAEETKDSCQITGESMLESSLNNTSQMEEPSVDSSDVSNSHSFAPSQQSRQGTFLKFMLMEKLHKYQQYLFVNLRECIILVGFNPSLLKKIIFSGYNFCSYLENTDNSSLCFLCHDCVFLSFANAFQCCSFSGSEADWEPRGHDTPDSAGRISMKTTVNETMTPPSFKMRDENFIAFSTPAEGPAVHPLQPVTDQTVSAAGRRLKTPGKPRKPRTPKAIWTKTTGTQPPSFNKMLIFKKRLDFI